MMAERTALLGQDCTTPADRLRALLHQLADLIADLAAARDAGATAPAADRANALPLAEFCARLGVPYGTARHQISRGTFAYPVIRSSTAKGSRIYVARTHLERALRDGTNRAA